MAVEHVLRRVVWSFAASAGTIGAVEPAVREALEYAIRDAGDEQVAQMFAACKAVVGLVQSGLWGSGPFSLALSGTDSSFYLSVLAGIGIGIEDA